MSEWNAVISSLRSHPAATEELPEALIIATGTRWQRDRQRLSALREYSERMNIDIPGELISDGNLDEIARFLKRSASQRTRRKREKAEEIAMIEQSTEM